MRLLSLVVVCAIACARTGGPPAASVQFPPDAGAVGQDPGIPGAGTGAGPDAGTPPVTVGDTAEAWCAPPEGAGPGPRSEAEPGLLSDCSGFVPSGPGIPTVAVRSQGISFGCSMASADEGGTVALGSFSTDGASGVPEPMGWEVLAPDGSRAGFFHGDGLRPLREGFAAVDRTGSFPASQGLLFSFAHGSPPPVLNESIQMDAYPGTGAVGLERPWNVDQFWLTVHRFDDAGGRIGTATDVFEGPSAQRPGKFGVAMALDGWSLVVFSGEPESDPGNLYARWVDPTGHGSATPFATGIGIATNELRMRPLFDGSIAVRIDGKWAARVRRTGVEPAPAWLASLAGRDIVPLARGYAVPAPFKFPNQPGCVTAVELRAPAGNLCARLALNTAFRSADVGADGTLFLLGPSPDIHSCRWRFWGGLFH